jgi:hypothetical protein
MSSLPGCSGSRGCGSRLRPGGGARPLRPRGCRISFAVRARSAGMAPGVVHVPPPLMGVTSITMASPSSSRAAGALEQQAVDEDEEKQGEDRGRGGYDRPHGPPRGRAHPSRGRPPTRARFVGPTPEQEAREQSSHRGDRCHAGERDHAPAVRGDAGRLAPRWVHSRLHSLAACDEQSQKKAEENAAAGSGHCGSPPGSVGASAAPPSPRLCTKATILQTVSSGMRPP